MPSSYLACATDVFQDGLAAYPLGRRLNTDDKLCARLGRPACLLNVFLTAAGGGDSVSKLALLLNIACAVTGHSSSGMRGFLSVRPWTQLVTVRKRGNVDSDEWRFGA